MSFILALGRQKQVDLLSLSLAWSIERVPGQPGIYKDTLSQTPSHPKKAGAEAVAKSAALLPGVHKALALTPVLHQGRCGVPVTPALGWSMQEEQNFKAS